MNNSSRKRLVAARLRYLRDVAGFTQRQVSDLTGIHEVTYSGYELGRACPCAEALVRLADIYQVSLDVLPLRFEQPEKGSIDKL